MRHIKIDPLAECINELGVETPLFNGNSTIRLKFREDKHGGGEPSEIAAYRNIALLNLFAASGGR